MKTFFYYPVESQLPVNLEPAIPDSIVNPHGEELIDAGNRIRGVGEQISSKYDERERRF
ncbi:hypothetical protein Hanom_Chr00s109473g01807171 [Helianthus anomalus]